MMFGLSLRVFFHTGLLFASIIPTPLSDNFVVKTEVGSRDKVSFLNSSCQVASVSKICESFGAQGVVLDGKNCSCSCPQDASTFGVDGENCKCLPNNISYGGCPKFSQIKQNVLKRNSSTKLLLPTKNCSLAVLYRQNNGSWITVNNMAGIIQFSQSGELNGSSVYVLKVSNSMEDFQGALYNVIVQCPKQNSTCLQLKLPSKMTCPFTLPLSSTRAPTNTTTPLANLTATTNSNSSGLRGGEIAAIVISCLVFLAIILFILFLWVRRKRQQVIKNDRRESRQQMTHYQDEERRTSEPRPVVFSRPNPASTQRKDSANLGFEPDAGTTCNDDNDEEPDYDDPIDENHSMISDFFQKIKRPLSVKKPIPKNNESKAEKSDNEDDEYQVMENLEKPDNLENTVVYENTRKGFVTDEPKPEVKHPTYKKTWRTKFKKKGKKPGDQSIREDEKELPKKEAGVNVELENVYENNEIIREHKGPSRTPIHEHRASYSNDVPAKEDDEEGPPPPPRTTSLENILDKPHDHRPIPSPRMNNKFPNTQRNDNFDYEVAENDPSELYENTRKGSYPKPSPRIKR